MKQPQWKLQPTLLGVVKMKWSSIAVLSWGSMTKSRYPSVIGGRPPKEGGDDLRKGSSLQLKKFPKMVES